MFLKKVFFPLFRLLALTLTNKYADLFLLLLITMAAFAQPKPPAYKVKIHQLALKGYYFVFEKENGIILDEKGNVVYYTPTNFLGFTLHPNGMMSYFKNEKFYFMDSTFTVKDSLSCKNYPSDFHAMEVLPNGHFLVLGLQRVKMNLSKYRWNGIQGTDTTYIESGVIQEQDAQHNVIFEWHAIDHFAFTDVDTFKYTISSFIDWTHFNAIFMDKDGNIIVSSRNFNELTKINHANGSIMWRWGGKNNQFKMVNCDVPFYGQHDIKRIANGNFTLFDNGNHNQVHAGRAMEFKLDEKNKVATLKWSYTYKPNVYSGRQGNIQRLDKGRTLISYGEANDSLCFVVIDSTGKKLFQVNRKGNSTNYRVLYVPQLPFELHRPIISCFDSADIHYLDAEAGYASYQWNTGESTRRIAVKDAGSYSVFVPYGQDGFISSEKFKMPDSCKK